MLDTVAGPFAYCLGTTWGERLLLWPALSGAAIFVERTSIRTAPQIVEYPVGETSDGRLQEQLGAREAPVTDDSANRGG